MLLLALSVLVACSSTGSDQAERATARIEVHRDRAYAPVDPRLLGTNVPAWLPRDVVAGEAFRELTLASGTTLLRLPGGSWSNDYDWLGCELGDPERCEWTWAMRPSDFLGLLTTTGLPAMWTASINGTAEEAAAAVAFFNGEVDDTRPLGTDREGRDWRTVGDWARLRAERGFPEPVPIRYWEVGNEVYGARPEAGPECASWGWEDVWTCDGTEYVEGTADRDGFRRFREAMVAVDPAIEVGAVGVGAPGEWGDWDDEVMEAVGDDLDFYVVHHYGSTGDVDPDELLAVPADAWPRITEDIRDGFTEHGIDAASIAVTEHNAIAFLDADDEALMTTARNAFYLASTIGELALNRVTLANQWNLANGRAENGSDYGLVDVQTLQRSPAYYAMVLWSRAGDELVAMSATPDLRALRVYATRAGDGSVALLVLNPSSAGVGATVDVEPATRGASVSVDVVVADSLSSTAVTFNGSATPSRGLTEPGQVLEVDEDGELRHEFPAHSMTLLRWAGPS